jgi:hypothetical protein
MAAIYASSKGACKRLKRPSIYKGCGNRQKRTPVEGIFWGVIFFDRIRFRIFPQKWIQLHPNVKRNIEFLKIFHSRCPIPQFSTAIYK